MFVLKKRFLVFGDESALSFLYAKDVIIGRTDNIASAFKAVESPLEAKRFERISETIIPKTGAPISTNPVALLRWRLKYLPRITSEGE